MFVSLKRRNGKMTATIAGAGDDDPEVLIRCGGWREMVDEINYNGFRLTPQQCLGMLGELRRKSQNPKG